MAWVVYFGVLAVNLTAIDLRVNAIKKDTRAVSFFVGQLDNGFIYLVVIGNPVG
jgi:hypothetical protein